MMNKIEKYIKNRMIQLPEGREIIRDFQDLEKWISSDSRMSMPGRIGNKRETTNEVTIRPFSLMKYPVTTDIYNYIMYGVESDLSSEIPVVNVSWKEAVSFCNLLSLAIGLTPCYTFEDNMDIVISDREKSGFRLPTDAEWQYACRAGSKGYRYGEIDTIAWYEDNSSGRIHAVGKKIPNEWKLYDMIGNVWEWCWDLYDEKRYGTYRIFRGGSWSEEARGCGATNRRKSFPDFKIDDLGFRIAMSL